MKLCCWILVSLGLTAWAGGAAPRQKMEDLAHYYYLPETVSGSGMQTMVGIVNPGAQAAEIEIDGYDTSGEDLDAPEFLVNLGPRSRAYFDLAQAFPANHQQVAWLEIGASHPLEVFAEIIEDGNRSAYWSADRLYERIFLPHVAKNIQVFETIFSVINGMPESLQATVTPQPLNQGFFLGNVGFPNGKSKHNILEFWPDPSAINWVRLDSFPTSMAAMEFFRYIDGRKRMAALGLDENRGTNLRFLHIATDTGQFWTGMVYINVGENNTTATEQYYDAGGNVLATRDVPLEVNDKITLLFDANTQDPVPAGAAWLEVTASQELVGYELFGSSNEQFGDFFAGLQGNYSSDSVLDYPHFQASANRWSGYVAVNLGGEPADITFHLMDAAGNELAATTFSAVGMRQKVTRVGADIFPDPAHQANGAWVRATTTGSSWAGFMLWGDLDFPRQNMSGLKAVHASLFTAK